MTNNDLLFGKILYKTQLTKRRLIRTDAPATTKIHDSGVIFSLETLNKTHKNHLSRLFEC